MAKTKKTHGEVVGKIMTREAREHVGYLYEWNSRQLCILHSCRLLFLPDDGTCAQRHVA